MLKDLKLSGFKTVTDIDSEFPSIIGLAAFKESSGRQPFRPVREWLILNGMNAGRFTSFFGAPCIADTHDCIGILEAKLSEGHLKIMRVRISLEPINQRGGHATE